MLRLIHCKSENDKRNPNDGVGTGDDCNSNKTKPLTRPGAGCRLFPGQRASPNQHSSTTVQCIKDLPIKTELRSGIPVGILTGASASDF